MSGASLQGRALSPCSTAMVPRSTGGRVAKILRENEE